MDLVTDLRESPFMYVMAAFIITFVIAESLFFIVKAWKRARELGISSETLKDTVVSSALFSVAPAISILATVIVLAGALGIVLPWIRLSVIGNLAYETVSATTILEQFNSTIDKAITDMSQFSATMWVMTIGASFPLILLPLCCKFLQKKIGGALSGSKNSVLADSVSAAAFIGIIAAFIAQSLIGVASDGTSAGFMSVATLISAVLVMLLIELICVKLNLKKLEMFAVPISIFAALGIAILLSATLPESLTTMTWR